MQTAGKRLIEEPLASRSAAPPTDARGSHYLAPGFLHTADGMTITTILGSCVAVCLWDPMRHRGGMNHFLLPRGASSPGSIGRFGETAVPHLIEELVSSGSDHRRLQAKVFGGACVAAALQRKDHLGLKNAGIALELLERNGISVAAIDVGGGRGRKVLFHTGDGTVLVKYL